MVVVADPLFVPGKGSRDWVDQAPSLQFAVVGDQHSAKPEVVMICCR